MNLLHGQSGDTDGGCCSTSSAVVDRGRMSRHSRGCSTAGEATFMSQYALEIPEALVQAAQQVARAQQTVLDDFVYVAIAEKIAASHTAQYFRTRAGRADPQAFLAVLDRIKQAAGPVVEGDEL